MKDSYFTIAVAHSSELKIERSRFIGASIPVRDRSEAESQYEQVAKRYHDATHNCFAFRIGTGSKLQFRYSDDGEPNGTAGRPIYDAIISHEVTDVLVVVTRYFGGIKLGTGGLARAYRQSADQVLAESKFVERLISQSFKLIFDHEITSAVMKALSDFELKPLETTYDDRVAIVTSIRLSKYEDFCNALRDRSHGKALIEPLGEPHD